MQEKAGPEWDYINQPTLEEVEKSSAHSRCREVEINISGNHDLVCVCVCVCTCMCMCVWVYDGFTSFKQDPVRGSTLDATIMLLCAAVRGIIQRKDQFVLKLLVKDEQVSSLVELEDIAKDKCAVKRTKRKIQSAGMGSVAVTVLELQPHCEYL